MSGFASGLAAAVRERAAALLVAAGIALIASTADAQQLDRNQIFELQFRLNQLGFEAGRIDGQAGGRTQAAMGRFADAHDTIPELSPAFLARVRAAARSVEGIARANGAIDFLAFTDDGTPLIFTVEAIGRFDAPGETLAAAGAGDASALPQAFLLPREAGVVFGVRATVPAPPKGETLRIDQVVSEPHRLADGTIRFTDHVEQQSIAGGAANPHTWAWTFATAPAPTAAGDWRFSLENAGEILLTRVFRVGDQDRP